MSYEYEELIEMKESNKINMVEFINFQDNLKDDYLQWRSKNNKEENDETAREFLVWWDNNAMDNQSDRLF